MHGQPAPLCPGQTKIASDMATSASANDKLHGVSMFGRQPTLHRGGPQSAIRERGWPFNGCH